MKKSDRFLAIRVLALAALLCPIAALAQQQRPPIAEQVAKEFGIDQFGQLDAIRWTFNLELGTFKLSRTWTWEPKANRVTYEGKDKSGNPVKVTYSRSDLNSQSAQVKEEIEPNFVNDQYWLVFPFHVIWDSTPEVTDKGMEKLPLGKGTADHLVVKYPAEAGGYTPGDTWELFIGPDKRVKAFIYRRGGPKKPSLVIANWTAYKKAGPLLVATDHPGKADGQPFRILFTDVAFKTGGSDTWTDAK
jgi:hypothetical protein